MSTPTVIILSSPTASGKTEVTFRIADQLPIEIISADSRQVFRLLSIGTAKPMPGERIRVPHHCVDMLEPTDDWNAGKFNEYARAIIPEIFGRGRIPCVAGGTGLYVRTLVDGIADIPETDPGIRTMLNSRLETEGLTALAAELRQIDTRFADAIDLANPRRVLRGLEIYYATGLPPGTVLEKETQPLPNPIAWYGLEWDRDKLYARIEERVDQMIERGLIDEVQKIRETGYDRTLAALQTVGYTEAFDYLEGKISRTEMIRLIKQNTRRFAKRQMTWFRKEKRIRWLPIRRASDLHRAADTIVREVSRSSQ
jgi:tRNA dimethylallyltransferase